MIELWHNKNYDEHLWDKNEVSIHQRHLRALICEVFKSLNNMNPEFMWSYFAFKNITYNIKKPFAEITCCKINFLRHKFSDIQSMFTLEQLSSIY